MSDTELIIASRTRGNDEDAGCVEAGVHGDVVDYLAIGYCGGRSEIHLNAVFSRPCRRALTIDTV
jgi:hypothetical protein